ncbi:uncharacterized protein KY384_007989 [Bacidia gigantensis]|uniref:uncharacterized protein n=1 Tax=Bacidia gigantensis TaxID=2732470 RepID=UPI001D048E5B|nr:uncharacterized protein KY384_007989 [Bacidia gigantensis]KAG8527245.1 hypothetical protein KY384_007989 [Bacidia gigantensis]
MKAWGRKNAPLACEVAYLQRNSRFAPQQKLPRICKKGLEPFNEIILGTSLPDNPTGLGRQDLKASTQLARHALLQELTKRPIFDHEHDAMGKEVRCRNPKVVKFQESMDTGAADKEPEDGERNKSVDPKMAIKYGHCGTFAGFTQLFQQPTPMHTCSTSRCDWSLKMLCQCLIYDYISSIKKSFESIYRDLPEGLEFKGFSLAVRNFKHAEHRLDKLFEDSFAKMESLDVNSILFSINGKRMGEQSKGKKLRALRQAIESGFGENWKSVLQPSCDLCLKTLPDLGMDESYHTYLPDNKVQAKQCDRDVMGVLAYARALRAGGGAPSPPGPDPQTPGQAQDSIGAAESGKEKLETIPGKINYYVRQGRGRANNGATKMYDEDGEKEEGKRNRQIEQFWTIIADAFLADGED